MPEWIPLAWYVSALQFFKQIIHNFILKVLKQNNISVILRYITLCKLCALSPWECLYRA